MRARRPAAPRPEVYHSVMRSSLAKRIQEVVPEHPQRHFLIRILTGKSTLSSSGFPYISEGSFRLFLQHVPHLFRDAEALLIWIRSSERKLNGRKQFTESEHRQILRVLQVLRNIVYSASVCAPPDLWILKHVIGLHAQLGLVNLLLHGKGITMAEHGLNPQHLHSDLSLLHSRGLLTLRQHRYIVADNPQALFVFRKASPIPDCFLTDMADPMTALLSGRRISQRRRELIAEFLQYSQQQGPQKDWPPTEFQIETGYRLLPLVLALHAVKAPREEGANLFEAIPSLMPEMKRLLKNAGMTGRTGRLTILGARVLQRGPGPFGIIHAYVPYMRVLAAKLSGMQAATWVQRGKNIAASQDANRKTFQMANDAFDRFAKENHFQCGVFVEHALGHGEATRQRMQKEGEGLQYFGADLEDAAIDRAIELQKQGALPQNMIFIRRADIGHPATIIDAIRSAGFPTENAVMFVGNGFHEVRGQTNERVVDVFRQYCDAGIIVIFTEESALNDPDLLATGWNTYHAGFRYVHELSGQGLRPVYGTDSFGRHSWRICASLGGYAILSRYCTHTRTIYPFPRKGGYNPPISMTYFCVPNSMARGMGFFPVNWGHTGRMKDEG